MAPANIAVFGRPLNIARYPRASEPSGHPGRVVVTLHPPIVVLPTGSQQPILAWNDAAAHTEPRDVVREQVVDAQRGVGGGERGRDGVSVTEGPIELTSAEPKPSRQLGGTNFVIVTS